MTKTLVLENLRLVTMAGSPPDLTLHHDALIEVKDGIISYAGSAAAYTGNRFGSINMADQLCLPGLVACHNPCLWVGEKASQQIETGSHYKALHNKVTEQTKRAEPETLRAILAEKIEQLTRSGVTTCELKSGFGGDPDTELQLCKVLSEFAEQSPMRTSVTLAIGHNRPETDDLFDYLKHIEQVIVPASDEADEIDAIEVFCDEDAALDLETCSTILELYYKKKTPSRVACDRFVDSAGATLPASFYSLCAVYLNKADNLDLENLAKTGTVAVIIPEQLSTAKGASLPDIDVIRNRQGHVALAPNTGPDGLADADMLSALRLGHRLLGLSVEETITAGTLSAARALGLGEEAGVIEKGRTADLAFFNADSLEHLLQDESTKCMAVSRSGTITRHLYNGH